MVFTDRVAADPLTSSLITQIAFNPQNQPANFTVGVSNPASEPLRIQTQNVSGVGENLTGAGQTVFIDVTTSSPTGRFSGSAAGPFNQSTITVTVTSGRQNSQDIFYRDTTPGTFFFTATVTSVANTALKFNARVFLGKTVLPIGVGRLAFGTQPGSTNKGATIAPPVTVRVLDAAGNFDPASTRNVSLAIGNNPSGGTLSGITTVAAVAGIATFNDLSLDKPGNGYTLVAGSSLPAPALTEAASLPFSINKLDQTIVFDELGDETYGDDDFDVQASSSTGAQVSFSSRTKTTCGVEHSTVHIIGAGICTVRASLAGDDNYNAAADVDRSFMINKADASAVVGSYDVVYDGQPHSTTLVSITGVYGETNGDVGTVDLNGTVHTNAGSYANDEWTFIGNANYNDASGTIANKISKASVTAHAGSGTSVYDGTSKPPSSCSISGPGYLGNLSCSNDPESVGPNANSYLIGAIVNGSGLSNFDIATKVGTYVIEKAPTFASVSFEPGPYAYRGNAFNANARVSGANGLDQTIPVYYSGDCVNVTSANGCIAKSEFPETGNYLGSFAASSITITKRPLDVTASSHVLTFGDPIPIVTSSFQGFVSGENASVIDKPPDCSTDYTVGSMIGSYPTNCSGGLDNNYSFANFTPGAVTVNTACSAFNGFLSPIGGANASPNLLGPGGSFGNPLRAVKLNSSIPFKFMAVCSGVPLTTGIQSLSARKYINGVPVGGDAIASSGDNRFQFVDGQWHLNFKTKDLGKDGQGTWLFEATLFDGSKYSVWLAVR